MCRVCSVHKKPNKTHTLGEAGRSLFGAVKHVKITHTTDEMTFDQSVLGQLGI